MLTKAEAKEDVVKPDRLLTEITEILLNRTIFTNSKEGANLVAKEILKVMAAGESHDTYRL